MVFPLKDGAEKFLSNKLFNNKINNSETIAVP